MTPMTLRRIVTVFLIIFLLALTALAQKPKNFDTQYVLGGGEEELLEAAEWYFGYGDIKRALPLFVKLHDRYPGTNAYRYYAGICYLGKTDEQDKAIKLLEDAYTRNPKLLNLLFYLGKAYFFNYKFDEAIGYFKLAMESSKTSGLNRRKIPRFLKHCKNAKELMAATQEERLLIENLGAPVNTEDDEYVPLVSFDESVLMYTYKGKRSRGGRQNMYGEPDADGEYYEDIYRSYRLGNKWLDPEDIGYRINGNYHDASIALSPDGEQLFIYKDENGGDIYESFKDGDLWPSAVKLYGDVNTQHYEGHVSISINGKTLYFVSDRPGGMGGKDIYKAKLQEDGSWGQIRNMGPKFNTEFDEDAPFIHANGGLLYFSSQGHNSMGGYDIFFSTLKDGKWEKAINLGMPINTPNDDIFYVVSANGERAYFSSARKGGLGGQDIYVVKPGVYGKKPVLALIKGLIQSNGKFVEAKVRVTNVTTDESYGIYKGNSNSGNYLIALPPGYDYKIDFVVEGENMHSENIDLTKLEVYLEIEQDFELNAKRNPFIDSTNNIQNALNEKLEEIRLAKEELAVERELHSESADSITPADTIEPATVKLYLLDENGRIIMVSTKNNSGIFNFTQVVVKKKYSFMLDSKNSELEDEIIIMITDENGQQRTIVTTVISATAEEAAYLESSNVLKLRLPGDEQPEEIAMVEPEPEPESEPEPEPEPPAAATANFKNILFDFDKTSLRLKSKQELDKVSDFMRQNDNAQLELGGHADAIGTEEYNMALSTSRAQSAAQYLVDKGVRQDRVALYAYGESDATASNTNADGSDNAAGRQLNRRVEFSATGKFSRLSKGRLVALRKARIIAGTTANIIYKVQVAAYRYPEKYNNKKLASLGELQALNVNEITRFTIGEFRTLREARKFKNMVVNQGTKDAFITAEVGGERRYLNELDGTRKGYASRKKRKYISPEAIAAYKKVMDLYGENQAPGLSFKVQVGAYRNADNYTSSDVRDLGRVDYKKLGDNITRFTIGSFASLRGAEKFRQKVLKRGVDDAFITALYNGKRILVADLIANNFFVL